MESPQHYSEKKKGATSTEVLGTLLAKQGADKARMS